MSFDSMHHASVVIFAQQRNTENKHINILNDKLFIPNLLLIVFSNQNIYHGNVHDASDGMFKNTHRKIGIKIY